jgi:TrmH family RNA methyltransferase
LAAALELDRLRVVLVSTRNPLNIGAAARALSNFGFSRLRVVNPFEPSFREARSAVGAASLLREAEQFPSVAEAVADCSLVVGTSALRNRDPEQPVRRLEEGARLIRRRMASGTVALLFGSEKLGLSNEDLSHCHWLMRIPTQEAHGSMNLGQAVAVSLYALIRDRRPAALAVEKSYARSGDVDRLDSLLVKILEASGYVKEPASAVSRNKMRRLVRRLQLSREDIPVWLGMLRQIAWKLNVPE